MKIRRRRVVPKSLAFRCPYCRQDLGHTPQPKCPGCGRTMRIPGPLREPGKRIRKRAIDFEQRMQRLQAPSARIPEFLLRGNGPHLLLFLVVFIIVGGSLIGRSKVQKKPARPGFDSRSTAAAALQVLRTALELHHRDCGRYPSTSEGLKALVHDPGYWNWNGNYIKVLKPDPWRNMYVYEYEPPTGRLTLLSLGPDGKRGTPDDLVPAPSWTNMLTEFLAARTNALLSAAGTNAPARRGSYRVTPIEKLP